MALDYEALLRGYRKAREPVLMFGPPGIGKSELSKQVADEDPVIDLRLSLLDPVDLRGLPIISVEEQLTGQVDEQLVKINKTVKWARPEFIPIDGRGILLLDELNTTSVAVMNAALQLVLDRRVGPHILGDGWWIIACCNKSEHGAHVNPISAPLRSRFNILEMEPNINVWTRWALENGVNQDVVGFLNFRNEYLYKAPKDEYLNFPNPRGWVRVSDLLRSREMDRPEVVTASVGVAASVEFGAYRRDIKSMPNIDKLLKGEEVYDHAKAKNISVSYAVALAVGTRVLKDVSLVEAACKVMSTIPSEIAALFFTMIISTPDDKLRASTIRSKGVRAWVEKHVKILHKYGFRK